jgi:hypothetical protein
VSAIGKDGARGKGKKKMQTDSILQRKQVTDIRLGLASLAGLSLFALYLYAMGYFGAAISSGPMDAVEGAIFYTMILRVLGLLAVPRFRRLSAQLKIVILSFEAFILVLLIVATVLSGSPAYAQTMADILTAWLVTGLVVVTPYTIYELALMMRKGTNVTSLAISCAPLVAICLFLANLPSRIPNPPSGIGNFGIAMINSLKTQQSFAGTTLGGESGFISGASVLFFLSLVVYIAFEMTQSSKDIVASPRYHYSLGLMVIGSIATFVWLFLFTNILKGNLFEVLSLPSAGISVILWVISRER